MFLLLKPYIPWSFSSFSMMISLHYLNFMTFTNTDDSKISYRALLHFPISHAQLSPRYLYLVSYRHFRPKRSKAWLHLPPPSLSPAQEMASVIEANVASPSAPPWALPHPHPIHTPDTAAPRQKHPWGPPSLLPLHHHC